MVHMEPERTVNGAVARSTTVTRYLDDLTFAMLAHARENLVRHRHDGHAEVLRERPAAGADYRDLDWHVILSDERGVRAAMSIEYGHGEYLRWVVPTDGSKPYVVVVPPSRPTYILTDATRIKRRQRRVQGDPD